MTSEEETIQAAESRIAQAESLDGVAKKYEHLKQAHRQQAMQSVKVEHALAAAQDKLNRVIAQLEVWNSQAESIEQLLTSGYGGSELGISRKAMRALRERARHARVFGAEMFFAMGEVSEG